MKTAMDRNQVVLITGTRKGIGRYLAKHYAEQELQVIGCSREPLDYQLKNYQHFCLDVANETEVKQLFAEIRKQYNRLDILINNAGVASMNHILLTPLATAHKILNTNIIGTFLFCREAAKLMQKHKYGRIVNFATVAVPLKLEGEAMYVASKSAIVSLTEVLAKELAEWGITVNAVGPTPIETELIRSIPAEKINNIVQRQAIHRLGNFTDVSNVIDFFLKPESDFVTGQIIYLGGV